MTMRLKEIDSSSKQQNSKIEAPEAIKLRILEILYSLHLAKPDAKDLSYITMHDQIEPEMKCDYNEIYVEMLYFLLTRNHGVNVSADVFQCCAHELWIKQLIEVPGIRDSNDDYKTLLRDDSNGRMFSGFWINITQMGIDYLLKAKEVASKVINKANLVFTEDGKLAYMDFDMIYDISELQRALLKILFSKEVGYNHKTLDVEEAVYVGCDVTKQRQDNLKKLVERVNKLIKEKFNISEAIHYSSNVVRRLI